MPRAVDEVSIDEIRRRYIEGGEPILGAGIEPAAARPAAGCAPPVRGAEKALRARARRALAPLGHAALRNGAVEVRGARHRGRRRSGDRSAGRAGGRRGGRVSAADRTSPGSTIPNASTPPRARISPLRFAPGLRASASARLRSRKSTASTSTMPDCSPCGARSRHCLGLRSTCWWTRAPFRALRSRRICSTKATASISRSPLLRSSPKPNVTA